jgi:hypothetical protein
MNNILRTKSNKAIASEIMAYSKVRIYEFKDIYRDVYYSNTDSIITGNKLPNKYINNDLGFMKDECNDLLINKGLFISSKLYGLRLSSDEEIIN